MTCSNYDVVAQLLELKGGKIKGDALWIFIKSSNNPPTYTSN